MDGMMVNNNSKKMKEGKTAAGGNNKKLGLIITKTWERCKSFGRGGGHKSNSPSISKTIITKRSKSCPSLLRVVEEDGEEKQKRRGGGSGKTTTHHRQVAPQGCFSVYVGPQMQRFVIKTEYANHPLFKMLLEEAESEYGYSSQGPLALPCTVDVFYKVLMEMEIEDTAADDEKTRQGCAAFGNRRSRSSYHLLSPNSRNMLPINHF